MDLREQKAKQEGTTRHPWERARRRVVLSLLDNTPPATRVLDVGCGDAFILKGLAAHQADAAYTGVDQALDASYTLEEGHHSIPIFANLDDVPSSKSKPLSHVLLLDVIEHIDDDVDFLRSLKRREDITRQSLFLITVPAHPSLYTSHDKLLGHFRRYTKASLRRTLDQAGMTIIHDGAFFSSLVGPRALEKTKELAFGSSRTHSGLSTWTRGSFVTSMIETALVTDFKIGTVVQRSGLPFVGLSLYALCTPEL